MGECQIFAAQVKIEAGAQQFHAHSTALDVPTGPAFAPLARPINIAIVSHTGFPESEISDGFLFVFIIAHSLALTHFVEVQVDELTISTAAALIFFD